LHGNNHLQVTKLKTELKQIENDLKKIQSQTIALEMRKAQINANLEALKEIK
jgi:prefoldin subunit 5